MLRNRKSPELYPPEFIKVVYDEKGRVIDIIPAEDPSPSQKENELQTKYQNIQPINIKQDAVLNWITSLGQQIKALREDLRLTAIFVQKKFNEFQPIILNQVENSFSKNSLAIAKRFEFVEKEISNLKNQYNSILKISEQASVGNNNLTKKLEEVSEVMLNRFNYLNSNVSAILKDFDSYLQSTQKEINELIRKIGEIKIPQTISEQFKSLDLRMSNVANEIAGSKLHEIETSERLKSLAEETKSNKLLNSEIVGMLSLVEGEIKKLREEISSINACVYSITSNLNQRMNEFLLFNNEINQRVDNLSVKLEEMIGSLKNEVNQRIDFLSSKQEELATKLFERMDRKFTRILNKVKEKKKMNKAKIARLFKKKLNLQPNNKILIVSDKRNSSFATILFDVARKINKKTVLVIMENREKFVEPEDSVREAMKQADFIIITTKYLEKTKILEECLFQGKKLFAIKKSLRVNQLNV